MVVPVLSWEKAWLILLPLFLYQMSFMFLIFPSISYPSAPSPKPSFAQSIFSLIIVLFRICGRGRGLVWGVRPDVEFMSLFLITFQLDFIVFFPSRILLFSGIDVWAILVLPSYVKPFLGFLFLLFSVSHVNLANIFVPRIRGLIQFLVKVLLS